MVAEMTGGKRKKKQFHRLLFCSDSLRGGCLLDGGCKDAGRCESTQALRMMLGPQVSNKEGCLMKKFREFGDFAPEQPVSNFLLSAESESCVDFKRGSKFFVFARSRDTPALPLADILLWRMFLRASTQSIFIICFFFAVNILDNLPGSHGVEVRIFRQQPVPGEAIRIRGGEGRREARELRHRERRSGLSDGNMAQHEAGSHGTDQEIDEHEHDQLSEQYDEGVDMRANGRQAAHQYEDEQQVEEEEEERFSYMKQAEREMRKAEEAEAERSRLHEEYMERRRRGEIAPSTEEVRDTLRWGDVDRNTKFHRDAERNGNHHRDAERSSHHHGESSAHKEDHEQRVIPEDMTIAEWLESLGLSQYAQNFMDEGWDTMTAVLTMSQEDLLEVGVKRGHVRRMLIALGRDVGNSRASIAPSVSDRYREASYGRGRPGSSIARYAPPKVPWALLYFFSETNFSLHVYHLFTPRDTPRNTPHAHTDSSPCAVYIYIDA
jgi:hypothetical protein